MTAILVGLLGWLMATYWATARSLRWWQGRQSAKLAQEAVAIRDGLLQDAFVVRRHLELLLPPEMPMNPALQEQCLHVLDHLHTGLKDLGDRLSTPHLEDSFPLAVQAVVDHWQSTVPTVAIKTRLPVDWPPPVTACDRLILLTLEELLRLILVTPPSSTQVQAMTVHLYQHHDLHELVIHVNYAAAVGLVARNHPAIPPDWHYLKRTFRLMTDGKCEYHWEDGNLTWHLQWRTPSPD